MEDVKDRTPCNDTVEVLESMLEKAREGEIRSVVTVIGWSDDTFTNAWSIDPRNSPLKVIGEMAMLHFELMAAQSIENGDSVLNTVIE